MSDSATGNSASVVDDEEKSSSNASTPRGLGMVVFLGNRITDLAVVRRTVDSAVSFVSDIVLVVASGSELTPQARHDPDGRLRNHR